MVGPPERGVSRVVAANSRASSVGVSRGMPQREAEGLCPGAVVLDRDLAEEMRNFEPVLSIIEEVVPRVEVSEPGLAFVPIEGAVTYYGNEQTVTETMSAKLAAADADVLIGVADGPFASLWAARVAEQGAPNVVVETSAFLQQLDVSVIGHDELVATFRWLGVSTLGALANLPRDAIASRFGHEGLIAHRLAHGEDRSVSPRRIPPELAVESRFEDPLELMDQVAFAARSLAARLMSGLQREGIAPHRIEVQVETEDGGSRNRVWRSSDPFTESALADRVWWQLRSWIESKGDRPGAGIVRLRLDPSDLSGDGRQLGLFSDESARVEAERALARAQSLVGPDAVLQATAHGGRLPSERVSWHRWGDPPPMDPSSAPASSTTRPRWGER